MNGIELFLRRAKERPRAPALWLPGTGELSFAGLLALASKAQRLLHRAGVGPGSAVLVVEGLGPRLYAIVIATLALGATVVLVEPWMPVDRIERVVRKVAPTVFIGGPLGWGWAARVRAIRAIRRWRLACTVDNELASSALEVVDVPPYTPGIITFTSGTTGSPKGVVRGQGYLVRQYEVLSRVLGSTQASGADLCVFANFVLVNLAAGRPSVIMPPTWSRRHLWRIDHLPSHLRPTSMTCGPAFLHLAMMRARLRSLTSIHVGGALTDIGWFERAFAKWPAAHFVHLYGSSEAEPVAMSEAREAVRRSREAGLFQTLFLGNPVAELEARIEPDTVWVTGPHVCPLYVGNDEENARYKRRDDQGRIWHDMGDRIAVRDGGWWYAGRSRQPAEDFELEQRVYAAIGSSAAFVHRTGDGATVLVGDKVDLHRTLIRSRFPEIDRLVSCKIARDRRHRARIDREQTLAKGATWLRG